MNFDDPEYVTRNIHVRGGVTARGIEWALTSGDAANWFPVTRLSHLVDGQLFGLRGGWHHLVSVGWHALAAVLLFAFLKRSTHARWPSAWVAFVFGLHPLHVESVAWVAERKNVLCTMFFFLTLWAYGWYARKPRWTRYLAVAGLFAAGLASKPMVITLPFVLLLLDYWPLARVRRVNEQGGEASTLPWSRLVIEKLPLLALAAASAVITMKAQQAGGAIRTTTEVSFGARIATAIWAYAMYLWKMVWPARLAPLYPHPGNSLAGWQVLVAAAVLIAISAMVWRLRTRHYLVVGWLWFLGTLVPVIGFVQVGEAAMADRYAYIPLIGIFVMIAFGVADWAELKQLGFWPAIPAAAVLVALGLTTHHQIGYWQSNYDLWSHTLAVTQNNFVAENNLGGALILQDREEEAHSHFEAAARINPKDPMSHTNLGIYLQKHGQMREAVAQYETAVGLTSDPGLLAQTYANLGAAHRARGDDEQSHKDFDQALRFNPNQYNAWFGLGLLAQKQGKLNEAISDLSRSVELQPTAQGYLELGRVLAMAGHVPEALDAYQQALKMSPDLIEAQQAADALWQQKK